MDLNEHATSVGKLLGNLQSLEFLLRVFLAKSTEARGDGKDARTDLFSMPIGAVLPADQLTNYDSLDTLIAKFNARAEQDGFAILDKRIVALRDALAHGRVAAKVEGGNMHIVKFDRPSNETVRVTYHEVMTKDWFDRERKVLFEAVVRVHKLVDAYHVAPPDSLPEARNGSVPS